MIERRPDPDALLAHLGSGSAPGARGRLKIFFGMAPGVGKTYAMLEAARRAAGDGVDLVIGYVEPHVRTETQALVLGLELMARRKVIYRGATFEEFDLEAALARKPAVVVLDELAHSNADGSTHAKRWQDVEDLLRAGIDVYTTLNVQHLESLNDVVARVTGTTVRETVPDRIFDEADAIELVDLSPEDLLERLHEGKVYLPAQAARAVEHFFRKGNLIALRELALRRAAERVGAQVLDYRLAHGVARTWPTTERLLVCVGPSPSSAALIRAAKRMAGGLHAPWMAVTVETPGVANLGAASRERLHENLRLAERLGADVATLAGTRAVDEIVEFARKRNVTKIIVGKPREARWREWLTGSFVYDLTRDSGDIDLFVISGKGTADAPIAMAKRTPTAWLAHAAAVGVIVTCTLIGRVIVGQVELTNLVMVYLVGVVLVALGFGRSPSVVASVLAVAAFDFFFVPPYLTFAVSDTQYLLTFGVMLATGLIISGLTTRLKAQVAHGRAREERLGALYTVSRGLGSARTWDDLAAALIAPLRAAAEAETALLLPAATGLQPHPLGYVPGAHDLVVAQWVARNGRPAGRGTDTLPAAEALFLPLNDGGETLGVLGVRSIDPFRLGDPDYLRLLDSFAGQASGALARIKSSEDAGRARVEIETERTRNALLSAVSHDLRTPLTSIAGASSTLLEGGDAIGGATRAALLRTVVEEAEGLNRLIGNLLDATRLDAGALALNLDWESVEELLGVVLHRLSHSLTGRAVGTSIPADLPLVRVDGALLMQVLQNLIENAIKYTPDGSAIEISAVLEGDDLVVSAADRGPGFSAADGAAIFDKFRRAEGTAGRPGAGLGLTICRGIIHAHGGRIWAEARPGGGAAFRFAIPLSDEAPAMRAAEESGVGHE